MLNGVVLWTIDASDIGISCETVPFQLQLRYLKFLRDRVGNFISTYIILKKKNRSRTRCVY